MIEFGAGKNLGQNLYISQPELRQHLVDLNPMLDLSLVNHVVTLLAEQYAFEALPAVQSLGDLEAKYAIKYDAPVDMTSTAFDDDSFDICISTNTLEHIPLVTLEAILRELRRVLKSAGIISAQIDYSDHYAHTDRSISKINYLRFSEQAWKRHNHKFFFQNRLRHSHYRKVFQDAGFEILREQAIKPSKRIPDDLDPDVLTGDDSDYCLAGLWVLRNC
ncbi:class I SAM-dependent methyltransferase [Pelagibius sp. Alg239-R121]|uniref:class I SAM-dependent methyltransferase n=1 Tax=Pelagibius sp. Alg239-R121 TaxID=2993448 RepID=UPI0024A698A6|nr:class I SAM-dependent methyltransferase [Pelagibius sp. Alg239-R121]